MAFRLFSIFERLLKTGFTVYGGANEKIVFSANYSVLLEFLIYWACSPKNTCMQHVHSIHMHFKNRFLSSYVFINNGNIDKSE